MFSRIRGKGHDQGDQAFEFTERSLYISNLKQDVIYQCHTSTNTRGMPLQLDTLFFFNLVVHDRCNYL